MDTSVTTLAETLRARGYRTGGFVTNTFLGRRFGFDQGFDSYVESGVVERLREASPAVLFRSLALVQIVDRARERLQVGYDPSFETALCWIAESRRPSLFFVHLMDVHSPYAPPPPFGPRFGADPDAAQPRRARRNRFGWRPSEPAYAAEVRFADTKIGRLRRALERENQLDGSILILTSDHGENLTDHAPNFSHGKTLFDATLRIVAVLRAPATSLRRGLEPAVFENVDVLPTLASLLGEAPSDADEGRSFHPVTPAARECTWAQLERDFAMLTPAGKVILHADGAREVFRLDVDPRLGKPRSCRRNIVRGLSRRVSRNTPHDST
jgi:arylsulfatase